MMPIPNDYSSIVEMLRSKTEEKKVLWKEYQNGFYVAFREYAIGLGRFMDDEDHMDKIVLTIRNASGETVDSFLLEEGEQDFKTLSSLYDMALRKARNIDDALSKISHELAGDGQVGGEPATFDLPGGDDIPF